MDTRVKTSVDSERNADERESLQIDNLTADLREDALARDLMGLSIESALRTKYEQETMTLREQNARLSCTLAAIQEQLGKANNKIHRQQLEIASLKCATGGKRVELSRAKKLRRKRQVERKKLLLEAEKRKDLLAEKELVIIRLETELQKAKEDAANIQSHLSISTELAAVGSECRGKEHVATIEKLMKTVVDLRKTMFALHNLTAKPGKTADTGTSSDATENSTDRHDDSRSEIAGCLDTIPKEIDDKATVIVSDPSPDASLTVEPAAAADDDDKDQSLQKKSDIHDGQNKDLKESLELSKQKIQVYVGRVAKGLTEQDLRCTFQRYGDIHRIYMNPDKAFAFVYFNSLISNDRLRGEDITINGIIVHACRALNR